MKEELIKIIIPNRQECLKWLYPICSGILRELPFSSSHRHKMLVAISEGLTNAYAHGNQSDPSREIVLNFHISEKSIKIQIEDEALLPITENINQIGVTIDDKAVCGRGLYLMKKIADEVFYEYDPKGINRLTLISNFLGKEEQIIQS